MVLSRNLFRIYFSKISPEIPSENTSRVPTEVDHMILSRICSNVSYGFLKHFLQRLLQTMLQRIPFRNLSREILKFLLGICRAFFKDSFIEICRASVKSYFKNSFENSSGNILCSFCKKVWIPRKNSDGIPRDVSDKKSESRNFWKKILSKSLKIKRRGWWYF